MSNGNEELSLEKQLEFQRINDYGNTAGGRRNFDQSDFDALEEADRLGYGQRNVLSEINPQDDQRKRGREGNKGEGESNPYMDMGGMITSNNYDAGNEFEGGQKGDSDGRDETPGEITKSYNTFGLKDMFGLKSMSLSSLPTGGLMAYAGKLGAKLSDVLGLGIKGMIPGVAQQMLSAVPGAVKAGALQGKAEKAFTSRGLDAYSPEARATVKEAYNRAERGFTTMDDFNYGGAADWTPEEAEINEAARKSKNQGFIADIVDAYKNPTQATKDQFGNDQQQDIANARGMDVKESQEMDKYLGPGYMGYGKTWGPGSQSSGDSGFGPEGMGPQQNVGSNWGGYDANNPFGGYSFDGGGNRGSGMGGYGETESGDAIG